MKKKYILLSAILGIGLGLSSCADQLDADRYFKDRMSLKDVFSSRDYTEEWLANAFEHLTGSNADVSSKGHTMYCFADDMYFGDRDDKYKKWKNGEYDENWEQGPWGSCYEGIRQASIFILNIDQNMKFTEEERADLKAQARFVRAYYYWLLLRKYGPIPLLPEEGLDYTKEYEELAIPRNTYDECADYIASEMKIAARDLPSKRGANNVARPTRGAALAARAKVLLYAASPINNPRPGDTEKFTDLVDRNGRNLIAQEYNEEKWAKAAAAALDVMKLEGGTRYELYHKSASEQVGTGYLPTLPPYDDGNFVNKSWPDGYKDIDPYESYRSLFNGNVNASDNPELIFTRGQNQSTEGINVMVRHQLPRAANGWNTHGLTQKQCDAYYMKDGKNCPGKDSEYIDYPAYAKRIDPNPRAEGFVTDENKDQYPELGNNRVGVSMQYVGREPRFYASVAYNGSTWYLLNEPNDANKDKQIFYYRGGGNGYTNTMFWLRTGIGVMKFVHPDDTNRDEKEEYIRKKAEPAIRYAEILLIYAEALCQSSRGSMDKAIAQVDIVRARVGMKGLAECNPDKNLQSNKDAFIEELLRERACELGMEDARFFDLIRYKRADIFEKQLHGLFIYRLDDNGVRRDLPWRGNDEGKMAYPTHFEYEKFELNNPTRYWWTNGFDPKWYLSPFPSTEVNKGYGLVQNPGW